MTLTVMQPIKSFERLPPYRISFLLGHLQPTAHCGISSDFEKDVLRKKSAPVSFVLDSTNIDSDTSRYENKAQRKIPKNHLR